MERNRHARRAGRDSGVSVVEILIAVVLIGGVVAGTMATLRATVISGTIHRDHSNAHAWLQSSSDVLYAAEKESCDAAAADNGAAAVLGEYDQIVDAVPNPQGWEDWQIRIVPPVKFWNAQDLNGDSTVEYVFGSECDPSLTLQLITLEVRSTDGRIIESVEIVK
jgi:hypothetical protein